MSSKTEKAAAVPTGIKIHELAKQLGIGSKDVTAKALELGIKNIKGPQSSLTHGQADRLRAKLGSVSKLKAEVEEHKVSKRRPAIKANGDLEDTIASETGEETVAAAPEQQEAPPAEPEVEEPAPVVEEAPEPVAAVVEEPPAPEPVAPVAASASTMEAAAVVEPKVKHVEPEKPVEPPKPSPFGVVTPAPPPPPPQAKAPAKAAPVAPPPVPIAAPRSDAKLPYVPPPIGSTPPKRVLTGPEVAPPIQRGAPKIDPRFGVVHTASESEKLHGPAKPPPSKGGPAKKGPVTAESKPVDDFKPQVSYPSIPEGMRTSSSSDEDERRRGAAAGAAGRRGPGRGAPGMKGFSSGPRRGMGLMREDDRFRGGRRPKRQQMAAPTVKREGPAEVTAPVNIKDMCEALGIKANALIKKFFEQGKMVTLNSILSDEDAMLYALEFDPLKFGVKIKKARDVEEEMLKNAEEKDKPEDMKPRAPVVTIMGHVDHGKTSLLDYIRNAKVAAGEAGGITQHIGAYKVHHTKGDIAFLDTPGHKAFTEMRARGANVTDIVILVVSAVDGVMPQTEEAISHAKTAGKKLVVAINKIDLPEANSDRIKGQLAAKELFVEGYGGDTGCVEVSAKTGQGIDELLDRLLLEAEVLELKANPNKHAVGTVVEAHKDQGRGIVSTLLVQEGTLKQGDVIIAGHAYGSVRQIFSDKGKQLDEAGPSVPVLVTGLSDVPLSGERFHVLESIKEAAEIAEQRAMRLRQEGLIKRTHVTLETLSDMLAQGAVASLRLVLKVDVMGSLAPLRNAIGEMTNTDARIDILHDGVGAINETDVLLADASDAIVIGFNVSPDPGARRLAEERGVELRSYQIIYDVVDEVRKALEGMLKPIEREVVQGHATVRQTFKISKIGTIAGCFVADGIITRNSMVRLVRDGKPVWSGKMTSLKREKDDAKEVRSGFECGIKLEDFDDIKQADIIESYTTEQVKRTLAQ